MHPSVDTHRLVSHDVGMTTRAERTWRPWRHEGDERTPLVSHEGRASQALRLGNLRRIVVAVCGLAGLVALACVYVPARRDAEVESKLMSSFDPSCSHAFPGTNPYCDAIRMLDWCGNKFSGCRRDIEQAQAKQRLKAICQTPSWNTRNYQTRACDTLKKVEESENAAEAEAEAEAARKAEAAKKAAEKELESKILRDLKMLGSHDAGTGYLGGAFDIREGAIVTQMTDLVTQANCGVRAFDFRFGLVDGKALFHHGSFFVDTKGSEVTHVLKSLVKWANAHPGELLVLMLKEVKICANAVHRLIGTAYDHLGGGYTADYKGCMDFDRTDAMRHVRLMEPFKDNRIQIHPDIDLLKENMESIMKKSKVPGGGHILVTPQGQIDDNWGPIKKFYWGDKTLDTLWSYFKSSLSKFKRGPAPAEDDDDDDDDEVAYDRPFWLQAHWQQKTDTTNAGYIFGTNDDMVEATTNSKINYHVLKKLQDDSNLRANVNVISMNEVCHAGPEIAQVLGTTVSAADKAECKKKCEAQGIYNRHGGETCTLDAQCQEDKCGFLRADDNDQKCCPPGQTTLKTGGATLRDYCTPIPDGAKCVADDHCKSGYCKGNLYGAKTGTCVRRYSKKTRDACDSNDECISKACGRQTAKGGEKTTCCAHGIKHYMGYDYCKRMSRGSVCWLDSMCASDSCSGNLYGAQKGKCD